MALVYEMKQELLAKVQFKDNNSTELKDDKGRNIKLKGSEQIQVSSLPDLTALSLSPEGLQCDSEVSSIGHECALHSHDELNQTRTILRDVGVQTGPLASFKLCKSSKKFKLWTGLNVEDFNALYGLLGGHEVISTLKIDYKLGTPKKIRNTKLSSHDKLYLFLMRLRRGLPLEELSEIFNMSVYMIREIFYVMTRLIFLTFKELESEMFVSAASQNRNKPKKMRSFTNLRVLLDGVSFAIQTPSNFQQQGNTYSSYESNNVLVFTVGISCNGATIFCSQGMEGSMSDKEVVIKSGLLDRLSKGDGVMTDRGYELTAELQAIGCHFYKPPSLGDRQTLTPEEEILTKAIASARIYTEHAMADIKDNRLLQGTIPITLIPVIDNLVYIAAYLRNFSACRIHDKRFVVAENV